MFDIESFAKSDQGLVRNTNEDVYRQLLREKFFILADGMGGHNAGEVAASKTVEYMCKSIQGLFIDKEHALQLDDLKSHITSFIENTNLWVYHLSACDPKLSGMGTTLCSVLFFKKFIVYSHVGDSRIYRFRNNKLEQLTNDHMRIESIKSISCREPMSLQRKVLTKAIGTSITVNPEVYYSKVKHGDLYMMSSDGLHELVDNDEIEQSLSSSDDLQKIGDILIDRAKKNGGHDNITLILMRSSK